MILVDTSVWIDYLRGSEAIAIRFAELLEKGWIFGASFIFGELLQGVKNKRERKIVLGYWAVIKKVDERDLWIEAGLYANEHKLQSKGVGIIDAAIICAAEKSRLKIWTFDKKLRNVIKETDRYG